MESKRRKNRGKIKYETVVLAILDAERFGYCETVDHECDGYCRMSSSQTGAKERQSLRKSDITSACIFVHDCGFVCYVHLFTMILATGIYNSEAK